MAFASHRISGGFYATGSALFLFDFSGLGCKVLDLPVWRNSSLSKGDAFFLRADCGVFFRVRHFFFCGYDLVSGAGASVIRLVSGVEFRVIEILY